MIMLFSPKKWLLMYSLLLSYPALSLDFPSDAPSKSNIYKQKNNSNQPTYYGSSGINPYNYSSLEKDEVFVADTGGDLESCIPIFRQQS